MRRTTWAPRNASSADACRPWNCQRALCPLPAHRPLQPHAPQRGNLGGARSSVQKFSEFIRNLVVPTNLNLILAKPLRGTASSSWTPIWCSWWWTTCSAATGASTPGSRGAISPTEQRIIQGLLNVTFGEQQVLSRSAKSTSEYVRSDEFPSSPTSRRRPKSSADDLHPRARRLQADMHLLPYSMLEPIRDLLYNHAGDQLSHRQALDHHPAQAIAGRRGQIAAQLGTARISRADSQIAGGRRHPLNIPEKSLPTSTTSR